MMRSFSSLSKKKSTTFLLNFMFLLRVDIRRMDRNGTRLRFLGYQQATIKTACACAEGELRASALFGHGLNDYSRFYGATDIFTLLKVLSAHLACAVYSVSTTVLDRCTKMYLLYCTESWRTLGGDTVYCNIFLKGGKRVRESHS
jgi:hypothetical protein